MMVAVLKRIALAGLSAAPVIGLLRRRALRGDPVTVLCYHTLRPDPEPLDAWTVAKLGDFRRQISALREIYDIVSLDDALSAAQPGARPRLVLTFDDGEVGMLRHLAPIVAAEALPVTVYVATQQIETGQPFWFDRVMNALQGPGAAKIALDGVGQWQIGPARGKARWAQIGPLLEALKAADPAQRDALADQVVAQGTTPPSEMTPLAPMSPAELGQLAASPYVTIGAHSHGHELLDQIPLEAARNSIARSRDLLEGWTGQNVRHFAYPNGNYTPALVSLLDEMGFASSTILEDRLMHRDCPRQAVPRIGVGRYDSPARVKLRMVGL